MKKWSITLVIFTLLFLVACGDGEESGGSGSTSQTDTSSTKVLDAKDFNLMYTNPKDYQGYEVTFTGQVFIAPEKDKDGVYLQVYADPENYEMNTLVAYYDPNFNVNVDDYVKITGVVKDQYEGENLLGATITAPVIEANSIEVVDYITAVAPTINTLEVNQEIEQHGVKIILEKIEFAEPHTRVYVKAINNSSDNVSISTYSAKIIVGNQQFEGDSIYVADYPELQSEILNGVESSGILAFPTIDPNTTSLKFIIEGYSDNWELEFEPFIFNVEK